MSELTTTLATYGAILSTVAIVWNIYRDLTDRSRLQLTAFIGFVVPLVEAPKTDEGD